MSFFTAIEYPSLPRREASGRYKASRKPITAKHFKIATASLVVPIALIMTTGAALPKGNCKIPRAAPLLTRPDGAK